MKVCLPCLLAAIALSQPLSAQVGKKYDRLLTYEEVEIRAVEPDGIRIMHKGGIGKIRIEDLPPAIVAELGLKKEDAEEHRKKAADAEAGAAKRQREANFLKSRTTTLKGEVLQVRANGILVSSATFTTGKTKEVKVPYTVREGGPTTLQPHRKVNVYTLYRTETVPETVSVDVVWLKCDPGPYIDGMAFEKSVFILGKYKYLGTDNAEHTVPSFTTDGAKLVAAATASKGELEDLEISEGARTGTGFFITSTGFLLTNHHVVENATKIEVQVDGKSVPAKLMKHDKENDVALLKIEKESPQWLSLGSEDGVGLAKPVFTVGFPQVDMQGTSAKFTEGSVSSLSGAGDDKRYFQISVPIQPGNSGSPLVDSSGAVIGIVTATLRNGISDRGLEISQNVNYALKASHAKSLLGPAFTTPAPKEVPKTREGLVKVVADAVVLIRAE